MRSHQRRNFTLTPEVNDALDRLRKAGVNISQMADDALRRELNMETSVMRREEAISKIMGGQS